MATVTLTYSTFTSGTTAQGSQVIQNFNDILTAVNGNLNEDNLDIDLMKAAASTVIFGVGNTGDTQPRLSIDSDGGLFLGPGGSTAVDTLIKRESAGVIAFRNAADSAYEDLKCDNVIPATALDEQYGGTGQTSYTKGDLLVSSDSTTMTKVGVGSNDQILIADSTESAGVKWGAVPNPTRFKSAEQTITTAGLLTIAHGLSTTPRRVWGELVCKTTDVGYAVNDRIQTHPMSGQDWDSISYSVYVDATNVYVRFGSNVMYIPNKSTGTSGAITTGNWKLVIYADSED